MNDKKKIPKKVMREYTKKRIGMANLTLQHIISIYGEKGHGFDSTFFQIATNERKSEK